MIAGVLLLGLAVVLSLGCHGEGEKFDNGPLGNGQPIVDEKLAQMQEGRDA
jgi:hypothetical protein